VRIWLLTTLGAVLSFGALGPADAADRSAPFERGVRPGFTWTSGPGRHHVPAKARIERNAHGAVDRARTLDRLERGVRRGLDLELALRRANRRSTRGERDVARTLHRVERVEDRRIVIEELLRDLDDSALGGLPPESRTRRDFVRDLSIVHERARGRQERVLRGRRARRR